MINEIELKALVDDLGLRRRCIEAAGARLVFDGRLEDRRWDTPERTLALRDHVLRVRRYGGESDARAELGWKGPTTYRDGFKVRDELAAPSGDPAALETILEKLGYVVTRAIDRHIAQYELDGAVIRFEEYPRMDVLVEVEGEPGSIERAIVALDMPRDAFTSERLPDFVARFEARTGTRAALCDGELAGTVEYRIEDA